VRPRTTLGIALDGNEVVALAPAGAAAQSGQLIVGDVVEEIDDVEVPVTIYLSLVYKIQNRQDSATIPCR
jgi:hypothetical protein